MLFYAADQLWQIGEDIRPCKDQTGPIEQP